MKPIRQYHSKPPWRTSPISPTCEVVMDGYKTCGEPTEKAYKAAKVGWMALCSEHAEGHIEACSTEALITIGETWDGINI